MEFHDIQEHSQEPRPQEISSLGKDRVQRGAVVFESAFVAADTEAHRCIAGGDAELANNGGEIGVVGKRTT